MRWLVLVLAGCTAAAGEPRTDEAPLVIELFTSQGCSSCPPADRLLDKLARAGQLAGRPLAPLSFHVDYWDDLGWADPYARPAWTERQRQYARALGDASVYTPELVIGGRVGMVGSHERRAAEAIAAAPRQQKIAATAVWSKTSVTIDATAPANADVWVAVWQDGTRTKVPRGENAGATLAADRVVRKLERVAQAGKTGKLTIAIDGLGRDIGGVAFAQTPDKQIIGSRLLPRH